MNETHCFTVSPFLFNVSDRQLVEQDAGGPRQERAHQPGGHDRGADGGDHCRDPGKVSRQATEVLGPGRLYGALEGGL